MAAGDLTLTVDLSEVLARHDLAQRTLDQILGRLGMTQEQVDAMRQQLADANDQNAASQQAILANTAELTAALDGPDGIRADIATIKAQLEAGVTPDLTGLQANVDRATSLASAVGSAAGQLTGAVDEAQELDAENPAPPPPAP